MTRSLTHMHVVELVARSFDISSQYVAVWNNSRLGLWQLRLKDICKTAIMSQAPGTK